MFERRKFIEIVPTYPLPVPIYKKEDYFTWPAKMMREKGYKSIVVTLLRDKQKEREMVNGIEILRFRNLLKLFFYLLSHKDAFVYAQGKLFPLFTGFFSSHAIYITHGTYGKSIPKYIRNPFLRKIYMLSLSKFFRVITTTPAEAQLYQNYGFKSRIMTVPCAVDVNFFSRRTDSRSIINKYKIQNGDRIITLVGNLHRGDKTNLETLILAFNIVRQKFPNSKLVIIGQYPKKRKINYLKLTLNKRSIIFTGWLPHLQILKFLNISEVFVNTSRYEGTSISIGEAAAAKVPLCISNIPTLKSTYKKGALYHDPEDHQELAQNIIRYFQNPLLKTIKSLSAYRTVRSTLDVPRVRNAIWETFNEALEKKQRNPIENEWKQHWQKSSVDYESKQIGYEDFYRKKFLELFKPGEKVLEAGCGFGRYCFWLEKKGINTTGIDLVKRAIEKGKKYAKEKGYKSKLFEGDVIKLPFRGNRFDGYISIGVVEHFRDENEIKRAIRESYRVLKTNGTAIFIVPNPWAIHMLFDRFLTLLGKNTIYYRSVTEKKLRDFGQEAGFLVKESKTYDFYFPFYSLLRTLLRRDIWILKSVMKTLLNIFDNFPILNKLGSGIAVIFVKNEN